MLPVVRAKLGFGCDRRVIAAARVVEAGARALKILLQSDSAPKTDIFEAPSTHISVVIINQQSRLYHLPTN